MFLDAIIPTKEHKTELKDSSIPFELNSTRPFNKSHIVYIKVHKAASSTIQSILLRFGMKNRLSFALPRSKLRTNQLGWPRSFQADKHLDSDVKQPDVLCYHSVLSKSLMSTMPGDSFYLTSIRDPFSQVVSSYKYYQMYSNSSCWATNVTVEPQTLMQLLQNRTVYCRGGVIWNAQSFDLGLPPRYSNNQEYISKFISGMDELFHFVIIVDYFDECLILLRDLLNWTNRDILHFKSNFNGASRRSRNLLSGYVPKDNPRNRQTIYRYLKADYSIYQHFKMKIEKVILDKRDYLDKELRKFRTLQNQWMENCILKSIPGYRLRDPRFKPYGAGSQGYLLTRNGFKNETCVRLAMVEMAYAHMIRQYQNDLLNIKEIPLSSTPPHRFHKEA